MTKQRIDDNIQEKWDPLLFINQKGEERMKLIMDISEEDYAETMHRKQHTPRDMDWADKIISNGTPLDEVKAKIQTKYDSIPWRYYDKDDGWNEALEWVLEIINNIGKAEKGGE